MAEHSPDANATPLGSPLASEAPKTTPWASGSVARDVKLTELRDFSASINVKEFLQCDFEQFQSHYFPFIPTFEDIKLCTTMLSEQDPPLWSNEGLPSFTFLKTGGAENEPRTFAPLSDIADALKILTIQKRPYNKFPLLNVPYANTVSDINGGNHRIDACLTWSESGTSRLRMTEVVVPIKYKLKYNKGDVRKNRLQLLSTAHHIMHDDARRNWVYGLTIEEDRVSVWYFSRSHCTKAISFSFIKEPERLLSILICLLFATQPELGFDPNVTLMSDRTYIYRLLARDKHPKKFYRTVESLFEPSGLCMSGRMTRVWKVQEIESLWNPVPMPDTSIQVLKDVWLDASGPTEGGIQSTIFADIREFASGDWQNDDRLKDMPNVDKKRLGEFLQNDNFKALFLCVQQEHAGQPNKRTPPECSKRCDLFSDTTQNLVNNHAITTVSQRHNHTNQPPATQTEKQTVQERYRKYWPRRRCFFIYDDVCKPLHDLTTVGHVVNVLGQTLIALQLMFCAGWVHRDVSSGNILASPLTETTYQAKLADLEYAKKFNNESSRHSDPKTGTAIFMAVEIQSEALIYRDPAHEEHGKKVLANMSVWDDEVAVDPKEQHRKVKLTPIIHTFQHDLESLWWITLWIITMRVASEDSRKYATPYFQNTSQATRDRMRLMDKGFSPDLHDFLLPSLRSFSGLLGLLRELLRLGYWMNGLEDKTRSPAAYKNIHSHFALFFRKLQEKRHEWDAVEVIPYRAEPILTKRKRDDGNNKDSRNMATMPAHQGSPTKTRPMKGKGKPPPLGPMEDAPSSSKKARAGC